MHGKTFTDSQIQTLVDKTMWAIEDKTEDLVTAARQFGTRIYKQSRVNGEDYYVDPYFSDETGKESRNELGRLTRKLLNQSPAHDSRDHDSPIHPGLPTKGNRYMADLAFRKRVARPQIRG